MSHNGGILPSDGLDCLQIGALVARLIPDSLRGGMIADEPPIAGKRLALYGQPVRHEFDG